MMTATERLENLLSGQCVDRPPFMPAIYDLKPSFLNRAPHTFGQNEKDIKDALIFEAEQLKADALTSGYDIYNIEAEAVGCRVVRDPKIPIPEIEKPLIKSLDEIDQLNSPDVITGRMGIFVEAANYLLQKYSGNIPVRGGVSGPFSMATKIFPKEDLFMESLMHPEKLLPLLRICTDTIKVYAKAFAEIGAGVVVFDSFVSPPLLSAPAYRELILPFHREIFDFLQELGVLQRTLIIGGNTLPMLPEIITAGATQFLLDFTIPLEAVREVLQEYRQTVFRVNLAPALFSS